MLSEKMQEALNDQLDAELYSAYLYLSMSAYFESLNLGGFANWMKVQAQEETVHAMKFHAYTNERGGRVKLGAVEAPPWEWDSPLAVFEAAYQHEQKVTGLINDLVKIAKGENDHATEIFLQWFVTEQVEEEDSVSKVVSMLELIGDSGHGLLMADRELGQRIAGPLTTSEAEAKA